MLRMRRRGMELLTVRMELAESAWNWKRLCSGLVCHKHSRPPSLHDLLEKLSLIGYVYKLFVQKSLGETVSAAEAADEFDSASSLSDSATTYVFSRSIMPAIGTFLALSPKLVVMLFYDTMLVV